METLKLWLTAPPALRPSDYSPGASTIVLGCDASDGGWGIYAGPDGCEQQRTSMSVDLTVDYERRKSDSTTQANANVEDS